MEFADVKPIIDQALANGKISSTDMGKVQMALMEEANLSPDQFNLLSEVIDRQARGEIEVV